MNKSRKVPMIVLVISLIFLTCSMFFVVYSNNISKKAESISNKLTNEYVENNFEIDLYDEKNEDNIELELSAKYIGNDTINENIEIKMNVNCYYVYIDGEETFTNMENGTFTLKKDDNKYVADGTINLGRTDIDSYSCSYKVFEVSGDFVEK